MIMWLRLSQNCLDDTPLLLTHFICPSGQL